MLGQIQFMPVANCCVWFERVRKAFIWSPLLLAFTFGCAARQPLPAGGTQAPESTSALRAYVGCASGTVYVFDVLAATGQFSPRGSVKADAVWMGVTDKAGRYFYSANLATNTVSAFSIDPGTGLLTVRNSVKVGETPAYVSLDADARHLLVASYTSGQVTAIAINPDGALGAVLGIYATGKNTHSVLPDPTGRFVVAANLGSDNISQFVFDKTNGTLTPNAVASVATDSGAGPRHIEFDRAGRYAYVANENGSTISTFAFDPRAGTLAALQTISLLPAGADPKGNTASDVHMHPSGKFVYASNRGHDSIAIFGVDPATGTLRPIGHQATGGTKPQVFALDPQGQILLAANRGSNTVKSFHVDENTGTLSPKDGVTVDSAPQWVGFVPVARR